jgi:hypothetical protein
MPYALLAEFIEFGPEKEKKKPQTIAPCQC